MTPAQRAKAEHIITGLRERERQLETRLAGWEYEALVLLQELAAEPVRVPVAWLVMDGNGKPVHATAWREDAHEHINDALQEHDLQEAAKWRVVPVFKSRST